MGVWIEIVKTVALKTERNVTPFMGVWIEMFLLSVLSAGLQTSLPLWECGLKYEEADRGREDGGVTPFMGVWIEIYCLCYPRTILKVTPFMGVWIEILLLLLCRFLLPEVTPFMGVWIEIYIRLFLRFVEGSLPLWECGLKFSSSRKYSAPGMVTPFMGVWIEIRIISAAKASIFVTPFMGVWIEILYVENSA